MADDTYTYLIVGGGLAAGYAIQGIRERDPQGSIAMIGCEKYLPYNRPPLTKQLWFGKKKVEDIFMKKEPYYIETHVDMTLDDQVVALDVQQKTVQDSHGRSYHFDKLLLATGGTPRKLTIPGGDLIGISYYRYLDDYLKIRAAVDEGKSAVVIGGGFIGSEIAAALNINKVHVTMVFPDPYLVNRVFPEGLGRAISQHYQEKGVTLLTDDAPVSIENRGQTFITHTRNGQQLESDIVIAGVGITPNTQLAEMAGLSVNNGIVVNEFLQTSHPDIFAAGDNANFPYQALGEQMRVEHWDNAVNMGKYVGRNMTGAQEAYTYMPYFFSDLFEFGYEAVGDVTTKLETFADWQKENDTGVIYYLKDQKVRGVMTCNTYGKLDAARALIQQAATVTPESLRGAIK